VHSARASVSASSHTLLVIARGLIVGVDDSVRGNALSIQRLSPGIDGVDISELVFLVNTIAVKISEHGAPEGHELTDRIEPAALSTSVMQ
jgi:hypothetical protein